MKRIKFITAPITDSGKNPDRPVVGMETVVLQGEPSLPGDVALGDMTCCRNLDGALDYHAVLNVTYNIFPNVVGSGLAQGFGENRTEAIQNALSKSREAATDYLAALDHLAKQINESEFA
ncbi:hypothetical protein ACL7TT_14755 [Microbulbifer sp. 2304DJ12-6]|uniref:hypothetical protein n=1 Tax=Microbulbifer sp. 2304DJ12-6 TaxID=3233340 RepID=UPI0039B0AE88